METALLTAHQPLTTAEHLAALRTAGYTLLPQVIGSDHCRALREGLDRLPSVPELEFAVGLNRMQTNLFNRDPRFVAVLDPEPSISVLEAALGGDCHVITQKGWRAQPGHDGRHVHVDHPGPEMPEDLCRDPRYEPPLMIVSALLYLVDIDLDLCPTQVLPGSHRAGRVPRPDETVWNGIPLRPLTARAGDIVLFRSDLWHSGGVNTTQRVRYVIETAFGRRWMAQKFQPYVDFRLDDGIRAGLTARQLRLLGVHERSNYG